MAPDGVFRALSATGWEDWQALSSSALWRELVAEGLVVGTEPAPADGTPALLAGDVAGVLRHERIPFVSYPYEWPFAMLRDAVDGISPAAARAVLSGFKKGVLANVTLHARMESRYADVGGREVKQ